MASPRSRKIPPENKLWDAKQAAAERGLTNHRTIYVWEARGKLTRVTTSQRGGIPLYRPEDVMAVQPAKRHRRTHAELIAAGDCNCPACLGDRS